jgi:hypothetical protein
MGHFESFPDLTWVRSLSLKCVPGALAAVAALQAALAARLLECDDTPHSSELLDAAAMAARLCVPETWLRTKERTGHIPGVRIGRYVRFRPTDVERALSERGIPK